MLMKEILGMKILHNHLTLLLSIGMLNGVYSKQELFSIAPTGFATFIFDDTNELAGHNGFYGTTTGNFTLQDAPLNVCCSTFSTLARGRNIANFTLNPKVKNDENYIKISPNPLLGNSNLRLQYKFKTAGNVHRSIINLQGIQVYHKTLFIPNSKLDIVSVLNVGSLPVPAGLYITKANVTIEKKIKTIQAGKVKENGVLAEIVI